MVHAVAFTFVVVLFGLNFPIMRVCNRFIPPFYGAGLRFGIAAVLLVTFVLVRKIPWPKGKALTAAVLWGLIAYGGAFGCLFFALSMMNAAPVAVLFATAPLFTAIFMTVLGVEKLTVRKLLGSGAAVVGSAWIYRQGLTIDVRPLPFLLSVGGAACAGLSAVILKRAPRSHPLSTNAVGCVVGGGVLLLLAAVTGSFGKARWEPNAIAALAWVSVMGTAVGFSLVTWLILHWSPLKVNYQSVLSPLVAAVSSTLLLGEPLRPDLMVGAVAVLAGAWAVLGAPAAKTPLITGAKTG
ncbi:MAG TPA: DMT family transporter [Kofleriaceae bacterium]|nr:DMT family transporter [Kofleriaceae bacterium]